MYETQTVHAVRRKLKGRYNKKTLILNFTKRSSVHEKSGSQGDVTHTFRTVVLLIFSRFYTSTVVFWLCAPKNRCSFVRILKFCVLESRHLICNRFRGKFASNWWYLIMGISFLSAWEQIILIIWRVPNYITTMSTFTNLYSCFCLFLLKKTSTFSVLSYFFTYFSFSEHKIMFYSSVIYAFFIQNSFFPNIFTPNIFTQHCFLDLRFISLLTKVNNIKKPKIGTWVRYICSQSLNNKFYYLSINKCR